VPGALPARASHDDRGLTRRQPPKRRALFSRNPSKAWGEKFFLAYSPVLDDRHGRDDEDGTGRALGRLRAKPGDPRARRTCVLVPRSRSRRVGARRAWHETYWFKFNLWIAIFATIGSYFGSEYFFDVLGMYYNYPQLHWRLDSKLLGTGKQTVPLIMYASRTTTSSRTTTCSVLVMRARARRARCERGRVAAHRARRRVLLRLHGERTRWPAARSPSSSATKDLPRMLRWGSVVYACYFVVSFPMVYRLDEGEDESWAAAARVPRSRSRRGCSCCFYLDLTARFVGTVY
jgi:cycloeucalenol cycloisomerase